MGSFTTIQEQAHPFAWWPPCSSQLTYLGTLICRARPSWSTRFVRCWPCLPRSSCLVLWAPYSPLIVATSHPWLRYHPPNRRIHFGCSPIQMGHISQPSKWRGRWCSSSCRSGRRSHRKLGSCLRPRELVLWTCRAIATPTSVGRSRYCLRAGGLCRAPPSRLASACQLVLSPGPG